MKIKDLPDIERPQEKLMKYGVKRLTDDELLAIIIGSGTHTMNALVLAHHIRKRAQMDVTELEKIHGIGKTKICRILASIEFGKRFQQKSSIAILTPRDVWNTLADIRSSKKEFFVVFYLDVQNQLIQKEIISIGTLTASIVHPREVFEPAIKYLAAQIIISHNHPSGECQPSDEDVELTTQLIKAGKILGIDLIDHVIVTKSSFYSFKEQRTIS